MRYPSSFISSCFVLVVLLAGLPQHAAAQEEKKSVPVSFQQFNRETIEGGFIHCQTEWVGFHADPVGNGNDLNYEYPFNWDPGSTFFDGYVGRHPSEWTGVAEDIPGERITFLAAWRAGWGPAGDDASCDFGDGTVEVEDPNAYYTPPPNQPPVASFSYEADADDLLTIHFDGSGSYDPVGEVVSYDWDFGDGETDSGISPSHTFEKRGTYTVTLTVTDDEGVESAPFSQDIEAKDADLRFVLSAERPGEEGDKTAQDEGATFEIGEQVMLKIQVTNTGDFTLENVQLPGDQASIEVYSDQEEALIFSEVQRSRIDVLEPGDTADLLFAYEAVHAVQEVRVSVERVIAEAVRPGGHRSEHVEISAQCEISEKVYQDDPDGGNKGCTEIAIEAAPLIVNSKREIRLKEGSDPVEDGCTTGERVMLDDGTEDPECTLWAALTVANARAAEGENVKVKFDIPDGDQHTLFLTRRMVVENHGEGGGYIVIDALPEGGDAFSGLLTHALQGNGDVGFEVRGRATIRGFAMTGFDEAIRLGDGATVEHMHLLDNVRAGVVITGNGNMVAHSVIAGSDVGGIVLEGQWATENTIQDNRIGTNVAGLDGGAAANNVGILIDGARFNHITNNLLSNNALYGVEIRDEATENTVKDNLIGTDVTGAVALRNGNAGIHVRGTVNTLEGNTIAGNPGGIIVENGSQNIIRGNFIGTNAEGMTDLGNGNGIAINRANGTLIEGNVISGNAEGGIYMVNVELGGQGSGIRDNKIGTDPAGQAPLGNKFGIRLERVQNLIIAGNVIAASTETDLYVKGDPGSTRETNLSIENNRIGTNADGTQWLGNGRVVLLDVSNTSVGTPEAGNKEQTTANLFRSLLMIAGKDNTITDNAVGIGMEGEEPLEGEASSVPGVHLSGTTDTQVLRNRIAHGGGQGIQIDGTAARIRVEGNAIFKNAKNGIVVMESVDHSITMRKNQWWGNGGLGIDLGNDGVTTPIPTQFDSVEWTRLPNLWVYYADDDRSEIVIQVRVTDLTPVFSDEFTVDFYGVRHSTGNPVRNGCDASGFGEGEQYLGSVTIEGSIDPYEFRTTLPTGYRYVTATATDEDGMTSEFGRCAQVADPDKYTSDRFDPNAPGLILDSEDARVTVTDVSAGGKTTQDDATLSVYRYDTQPEANFFGGAATTDDGTFGTAVSASFRYYDLVATGLVDAGGNPLTLTYDVCLNVSGLTSDAFTKRLLLLQRNETTDYIWQPHDTRIEQDGQITFACAEGVAGLGEFSFGLVNATAFSAPVLVAPEDDTPDASETPMLAWEAIDGVASYDVQVARSYMFDQIVFATTGLTSASIQTETEGPGLRHYWRVRGVDASGEAGPWSLPWSFRTGGTPVDTEDAEVPSAYVLEANYPNPFNPQTMIPYVLPELSEVRLSVFDVLGREVAVLVDGVKPAGRHEVVFEAGDLPSGVYLYRIEAGSFNTVRQMLLLK